MLREAVSGCAALLDCSAASLFPLCQHCLLVRGDVRYTPTNGAVATWHAHRYSEATVESV